MRRSTKIRRRALWIVAALFLAAVVLGYWSTQKSAQPVSPASSANGVETVSLAPKITESAKGVAPIPGRSHKSGEETQEGWERFQDHYGSTLTGAFTADRRLVRIRAGEAAAKALEGFKSGDRKSALSRAEAILHSAGDLIGLNPSFPLVTKNVSSDEISSQIEWAQSYQGVLIEPFGKITLQLDSEGGLHALYSSYVSDPKIINQPVLSDTQARSQALPRLHFTPDRPLEAGPPPKGELVLYARGPQDSAQPIELRYSYRYWISGREVIVDAATGEILQEKDRRQF